MTIAGTAPATQTKSVAQTSNEPGRKTRLLGEDKLDRLATGITVDTEEDSGQVSAINKPGQVKQAGLQFQAGVLSFVSLSPAYPNIPAPREMILLNNLKSLFQKQLPMMPREYITRLVFDKNSHCVAIVKKGLKVVGGICFRVFEHRGFVEIVFLATVTVIQGQGYGAMLMNRFKMHIKDTYPGLMHLLTYADNIALGYFKKQGFTKDVSLNRSMWAGYIKDYEGATLVQCTLLPKVDYTESRDILAAQRDAILAKIRKTSKANIVYAPLPQFLKAKQGEDVTVDWQSVPGLCDSGWSPSMMETYVYIISRPVAKNPKQTAMANWLSELQRHNDSWPFREPVNGEDVTDYHDVIKHPMDFSAMERKLEHNLYPNIDAFIADANLVFNNCWLYNPEDSLYAKCARKLAKFFADMIAEDKEKIMFEE
ncbi:hypothetical protein BU17DRAFT_46563 [Hysterangium stoloniferum]|nr:hypothetical protein BU17DRAFT_46563 [Hysterangium stoloniferum]